MSVLAWIVVMSFAGGTLSVAIAAGISYSARAQWVSMLVSYAIGALLGAAFLEVLPHALESGINPELLMGVVLGGILIFFLLEKLVLWRHCHHEACEGHDLPSLPSLPAVPGESKYRLAAPTPLQYTKPAAAVHRHERSGMLIVIGDSFHNFVDGVLIAAAFMQDVRLGIVTAMAMIAHEIPQEVGDYVILLHAGYTKLRAFVLNLLSSFATLAGGLVAYYGLLEAQEWVPLLLALAASSMIYVAVADLIPGLHKRTALSETLSQVVLILLGVVSVVGTHHWVEGLLG